MEVANMTQKESSLAVIKKVSTAKTRVLALNCVGWRASLYFLCL